MTIEYTLIHFKYLICKLSWTGYVYLPSALYRSTQVYSFQNQFVMIHYRFFYVCVISLNLFIKVDWEISFATYIYPFTLCVIAIGYEFESWWWPAHEFILLYNCFHSVWKSSNFFWFHFFFCGNPIPIKATVNDLVYFLMSFLDI